ncbi:MAG: TRAP transporter substrate-binding protein DctP [Deltaproteobacteria bacterium]|nr:TRAP transporter substrate-binding protein DctP [Deltaproteobacteria bacterium]
MKQRRGLMVGAIILAVTVSLILLPSAGSYAKSPKPITLSFVSFVPLADKIEYQSCKRMFIDKVNEKSKGELEIIVRGGPEVIRPFDLGVSVQRGTIDMAFVPTAFFESLVPGADSTKLSIYSAMEERKNGVYEYIAKMYKKSGLYYLGREATMDGFFFLYLNKSVRKKEDFKGLKFGGSTAFHGFYRKLGGSVATIPLPEYHSAMDRGVVDGIATALSVGYQFGLAEASKAIIGKGFYRGTVAIPMNLKKWNSLPKHLQKVIMECMVEYEKGMIPFEKKARADFLVKTKAKGVEIITLSPEDEKWFVNAAREGSWEYAQQRYPGDLIPNLRARITK